VYFVVHHIANILYDVPKEKHSLYPLMMVYASGELRIAEPRIIEIATKTEKTEHHLVFQNKNWQRVNASNLLFMLHFICNSLIMD
jgi:hypothetical protein